MNSSTPIVESTFKRIVYDIETNGLLPGSVPPPFCMDRIHCLVIKDMDTLAVIEFVNNEEMDNIAEGVRLIMEADLVVGHGVVGFDNQALRLIYPHFETSGRIYDTLVMVRMTHANQKEKDYRLFAAGKLAGALIGRHGLEAWGERLGQSKGDYKKRREEELKKKHRDEKLDPPTEEELHFYVWGTWNEEMQTYCVEDVELTYTLWLMIQEKNWAPASASLEHSIHALMVDQETNGFLFDKPKGEALTRHLREEYDERADAVIALIGTWYRPCKKHTDVYTEEHGENSERRTWGDVSFPKKTMSRINSQKKAVESGLYNKMMPDMHEGCPFVKVEALNFNPNSRTQIIDRLKTLYGWEPQEFTEKNNAKVDDEILRNLAEHIPLADSLAEIFFYKKCLGQLADGPQAWLKLVGEDGRIHGSVNVGGTVTGRGTHARPNISQVKGVQPVEYKNKPGQDISFVKARGEQFLNKYADEKNSWGAPIIVSSKWEEDEEAQTGEWKITTRGRTGQYGYDCRELFIVPEHYKLVGCDLEGIEFRCLAELTAQFDDGELIEVVLHGDLHQKNANLVGISRSIAKRVLYALMYGGGDAKLGYIVEPLSSEARQQTIGKKLRAKLMEVMPSLAQAIKAINKEMRKNNNTIAGLDGRRLYIRSPHAALNSRLQSDGAMIAKKWCLLVDDAMFNEGWDHGVGLEYYFCSWSHDEIQNAVKEELAPRAKILMEEAAPLAGEFFNFRCPITAKAVIGNNWAETH